MVILPFWVQYSFVFGHSEYNSVLAILRIIIYMYRVLVILSAIKFSVVFSHLSPIIYMYADLVIIWVQ